VYQKIKEYIHHLRLEGLRVSSLSHKKQVLLSWVEYQNKRREIKAYEEIRSEDIEAWLTWLRRKKLSSESIENYFRTLKGLFVYIEQQHLKRRGSLLEEKTRLVELLPKLRKHPQKLKPTLNEAQVIAFVDKLATLTTLVEKRDCALVSLLYASGLRISEACSLKLEDIDLKNLEIHIREGKGGKGRIVPLLSSVVDVLQIYIKQVRSVFLLRAVPGEVHVFLGHKGNVVSKLVIEKRFRIYRERFNLPKSLTPHELRRAFSLHMLRRGMNIRDVQQLLGHERLSTTERYTRIEDRDLKKQVDEYHFFKDEFGF
jgi:site-specific recombinase XerD